MARLARSLNALLDQLGGLGEGIDEQARSALRLLSTPSEGSRASFDPARCPNCDAPCDSLRTPYCGDGCREQAAFVRQMRAALDSGAIADPERQVALGQKLWHLLGGGRPLRLHIAPPGAIRQAIAREGGRCQACGAPATTVDHHGKSG